MPLTFPSHAAAVLPFCGRRTAWLPPSALVVGSCAPDFAYLIDLRDVNLHAWPYCLVPCLPIAFAVWLWAEVLVLPSLRRVAPVVRGVETGRFLATRPLPEDVRGWLAVGVALGLGMLTHLAWDGFTHAHRFPASVLYGDDGLVLAGRFVSIARLLQAGCSVLGAVLVARAAWEQYPRQPPVSDRAALNLPAFAALISAALLCSWAGLALSWSEELGASLYGAPWQMFWWSARGALLGLTAAAALERVRFRAAA